MDEKVTFLLSKAQTFLRSAAVLLELEDYDSCASRSYFAMFHAAQALLLAENERLPEQKGIRSAFVEQFVDSGPFPERAGTAFHRAHELMEAGDYSNTYSVGRKNSERILQEAEAFVNSITDAVESPA